MSRMETALHRITHPHTLERPSCPDNTPVHTVSGSLCASRPFFQMMAIPAAPHSLLLHLVPLFAFCAQALELSPRALSALWGFADPLAGPCCSSPPLLPPGCLSEGTTVPIMLLHPEAANRRLKLPTCLPSRCNSQNISTYNSAASNIPSTASPRTLRWYNVMVRAGSRA